MILLDKTSYIFLDSTLFDGIEININLNNVQYFSIHILIISINSVIGIPYDNTPKSENTITSLFVIYAH